jgi:hypothetical protein
MQNKEGLFAFIDPQPEKGFVGLAKAKGSDFALNALFLITPMVLGGRTEPFFKRISVPETFHDYSWVFDPERVAMRQPKRVEQTLFDFLRPAGRQAEPIYQWHYNCRVITQKYEGQVRNYLDKRDGDAERIYEDLIVAPRAKSHRKEIRRFGPKIAKLFIQWVREYDLYELNNTDKVGLPVDFQVARVTIQTGGVTLEKPVHNHFMNNKLLPIIFEELATKGYKPEEISKALWAIGSGGCAYKRHELCPVKDLCTRMISSRPYDRKGIFDPTDVGRYK